LFLRIEDAEKETLMPVPSDGKHKTADNHTFNQAWAEMEKIYASGRAKAIGVSNFSVKKCVPSLI
jgi:diketogulonate reductase-like aldo/keto reductase